MSDNWILIFPNNPYFQPPKTQAEEARQLLETLLPKSQTITFSFSETPQFRHAGGNWEGVFCPNCGADIEDWWQGAIDKSFQTGFEDLSCTTSCCGAETNLNTLNYPWHVGFSSFNISAMNPGVSTVPGDLLLRILGIFGVPLSTVYRHI